MPCIRTMRKYLVIFATFPKRNPPWKVDWIKVIRSSRGEENWLPSDRSLICSAHFDENDFYLTKKGYSRLVTYAVPKRLLSKPPDYKEKPAKLKPFSSSRQCHDKLSSSEASISLRTPSLPQPTTIIGTKETDSLLWSLSDVSDSDQISSPEAPVSPSTSSSLPQPPSIMGTIVIDSSPSSSSEVSDSEEIPSSQVSSSLNSVLLLPTPQSVMGEVGAAMSSSFAVLDSEHPSSSEVIQASEYVQPSPSDDLSTNVASNVVECHKRNLREILKTKEMRIEQQNKIIRSLSQKYTRLRNQVKHLKNYGTLAQV